MTEKDGDETLRVLFDKARDESTDLRAPGGFAGRVMAGLDQPQGVLERWLMLLVTGREIPLAAGLLAAAGVWLWVHAREREWTAIALLAEALGTGP